MEPGLLDLRARAVFFPVRHHSPACARAVRRLALELRPSAILIEGPSDFNDRIHELFLPHRLPIAIYTYLRFGEASRGAYYPFCVYSPEWQALQAANELGIPVRFIDLPWQAMLLSGISGPSSGPDGDAEAVPSHLYADGELRFNDYIEALCRRTGVDSFDALWDTLFEIDQELGVPELMRRCHTFCFQARALDRRVPEQDLRREAFMAEQIRSALLEFPGQVLVVTGGFHSSALHQAVMGRGNVGTFERGNVGTWERENVGECEGANVGTCEGAPAGPAAEDPTPDIHPPYGGPDTQHPTPDTHDLTPNTQHLTPTTQHPTPTAGISLTPYSYERLDNLTGYDSGMPNPGFYHAVWEDRTEGRTGTHRRLLARVVRELRKRGQRFSTADLIAVETTASALASLRGHDEVWRVDLIDGILGALVKDELELGVPHPFLEAVHAVFRGGERGKLAEGAELPPLVHDLRRLLHEHDLEPSPRERTVELELTESRDLERSRLLHRLGGLGIPGYERTGGTDLAARDDLSRFEEQWRIRWSPEFEAACIESALYGPTLQEAVSARLRKRAAEIERDAEAGARLLLEARLMGLSELAPGFRERLVELIREDGDFLGVSSALGHLVYLYRYDEVLGSAGDAAVGVLLTEAWTRGLWLLESMGQPPEEGRRLLEGIRALVQTYESCGADLDLGREELLAVFQRISGEDAAVPLMRGAAAGALWTLGETDTEAVLAGIRFCSEPDRLGDYLAGLFALARETIQRHPELAVSIDGLLMAYSDEQFLEALPALRLAFSFFTPREKHYLAQTLLKALGMVDDEPLAALEVSPETAARALVLEAGVFQLLERYGLRGGSRARREEGAG